MKKKNKIILISNFQKDDQASMLLYTEMLVQLLGTSNLQVSVWRPFAFFSLLFSNTHYGLAKWLAYMDKWVLTMCWFAFKSLFVQSSTRIHVCDHSNAPYRTALFHHNISITCHDVLAIRGALGYKDAFCEASAFGVYYQKWILYHLKRFKKILCVSTNTLEQLMDLSKINTPPKGWEVIYNPINQPFQPVDVETAHQRLLPYFDSRLPFILHVGSHLPRKNKAGLIQAYSKLKQDTPLYLVLAGQPLSAELKALIQQVQCEATIINIENPLFELLEALYSSCKIFAFPSFSEGFGWPIVEAQQCGALVVTSDIEPMKEVGGAGVILCNPYQISSITDALDFALHQTSNELKTKGYENAKRFHISTLKNKYLYFFASIQ